MAPNNWNLEFISVVSICRLNISNASTTPLHVSFQAGSMNKLETLGTWSRPRLGVENRVTMWARVIRVIQMATRGTVTCIDSI